MTYLIRFPIGDWSDDGHGKCEYFICQSNYTVQQIRELHFKASEVIGFDIGKMCCDYECSTLDDDIVIKLLAIGIDPRNEIDEEECWMDPEKLIDIWLDILKHVDYAYSGEANTLEIERIKPDYEDINFYGSDEKSRHLETPGYGVFYS